MGPPFQVAEDEGKAIVIKHFLFRQRQAPNVTLSTLFVAAITPSVSAPDVHLFSHLLETPVVTPNSIMSNL